MCCLSFLFDAAAIAETYTLSLHDALPIYLCDRRPAVDVREERSRQLVAEADPGHVGSRILQSALRINVGELVAEVAAEPRRDRKSTRLNSSHLGISYAVFCLKKKNNRHYRLKRIRQILARVRHDLRRRPAPLRRIAIGLRTAMPRPA